MTMKQTPQPPARQVPAYPDALAQYKAQLARMSPEEHKKAIAALAQVVKAAMQADDPR